jgi:2-dehydro-3-deoxyglucarate aldolase/4-hydroxy-2-oxoheptanedioate aldolase
MDLPVNSFKRALHAGRPLFGVWLMSGAASTAEAMGCAGFDFVVVDTEHVPVDAPQMIDLLRAVAGTPAPAVVRLPWNDIVLVKRALDAGAQTVMLPFVQNADEAARAVAYTRYPPEGVRGVAGVHRANRYSTVPGYFHAAAAELCVAVQIETAAALEALPAIAAVPGIDTIFIGPNDLAASMGLLGDMGHPRVKDALRHAARMCQAAGMPCGIIGGTPETVGMYVDYGYTWIAIGSDMGFMVGRAQEWLGKARAHPAPAAAGGA